MRSSDDGCGVSGASSQPIGSGGGSGSERGAALPLPLDRAALALVAGSAVALLGAVAWIKCDKEN